jgi:Ca2+-binding RTX toxin-like protein
MRLLKMTSLGIATTATFAAPLSVPAEEVTSLVGVSIKCPYIPDDLQEIPTCDGKVATCVGTSGHDLILGTDGDDVIVAGPGKDVIHTDAGDDIACGGPGDDFIHGATGMDVLYGEEGNDHLFGARDQDTLYGGPGDFDVLFGGPGNDILDGGAGGRDFCLQQRDMAEVRDGSCEVVYPPIGYSHDQEAEIAPGIIPDTAYQE